MKIMEEPKTLAVWSFNQSISFFKRKLYKMMYRKLESVIKHVLAIINNYIDPISKKIIRELQKKNQTRKKDVQIKRLR